MKFSALLYTVLPAESDSYLVFCLQGYQGLRIDRSLVFWSYLQDRINTQVIYWFALAQVMFYLSTTSLLLLVGKTVDIFTAYIYIPTYVWESFERKEHPSWFFS